MSNLLLFSDASMLEHRPGPGHPERPDRLAAVLKRLDARPVPGVEVRPAPVASREALLRVHDPAYVDRVEATRGRAVQLDPDTATSPGSVAAAHQAAGAAMAAVEHALAGGRGFALGRPPGHHAEWGRAMGFCLFNNVAVAAAHALEHDGVDRVLIIDWDVHHGNGTQHTFEARDDVLFFSTHQGDFYPGTGLAAETGRGRGAGHTVNVPMAAGAGDEALIDAFRRQLVPAAERFQPDLVLVSAGFDAHAADPLAGLQATEEGFAELTEIVVRIAEQHAGGRIALTLEGGYDLDALASSVRRTVEVLAG